MGKSKKSVRVNMGLRYIAAARLHDQGVDFVGLNHEVFRVWKGPYKHGLTAKEQAYLQQLWNRMSELQRELSAFNRHLDKSVKIDWSAP